MPRRLVGAYILLSHGPRPADGIAGHSAARQQKRNLKCYLEERKITDFAVLYDYRRTWSRLEELPALASALELCRQLAEGHVVLMDDLNRLFRGCDDRAKPDFFAEVSRHNEHLFGLRQGKVLANCTTAEAGLVLHGYGTARFIYNKKAYRRPRSLQARQRQTSAATVASTNSRTLAANAAARAIADVRDDLAAAVGTPTLQAVADEANRRGIKTARGSSWSVSSVHRALARLSKSDRDEA
ncbi:hypothetical protein [Histidinibacterium aquaticum]|uniref:Resolvase/invertase-type recombinase catalytic domain-containing protein n=1 Tax=Histidinibacterium aquaticum TaxID=2613962 RepID=A0A5J5GNY5_9RHOB|nr:hypothetical protein [Histidinibacterium aquaticum]KAA9010029.1 hypothetical protein F3S47_01875 [Histidinibacterium aquaticum]